MTPSRSYGAMRDVVEEAESDKKLALLQAHVGSGSKLAMFAA